jgi:hypothetical protein
MLRQWADFGQPASYLPCLPCPACPACRTEAEQKQGILSSAGQYLEQFYEASSAAGAGQQAAGGCLQAAGGSGREQHQHAATTGSICQHNLI